MIITTRDFHGWTIEDAIKEVHRIVGTTRMVGAAVQVVLVTGHGVIQGAVMDELTDLGLKPSTQLGNSGVVTVIIE